jgi:hypothetical protein
MTKEQELEGNKLIAEFDGWKKMPKDYSNENGDVLMGVKLIKFVHCQSVHL